MPNKLLAIVGIGIGVVVTLLPIPLLSGPLHSIDSYLVEGVRHGGFDLVSWFVKHGIAARISQTLVAVIAVMTPGLVAVVLSLAMQLARIGRRILVVSLGVLIVAGFFVLPVKEAAAVAVITCVTGLVVTLLTGGALSLCLMALAGADVTGFIRLLVLDGPNHLFQRVSPLVLSTIPTIPSGIVPWILVVISLIPFIIAYRIAFR